uniref:Diacylglycerol kinase, theta n=2 Tax=Mus musculus TaxID=10090 RepID=D6RI30_MOUSE
MAAAAEPGARTWPGSGSPRLGSPAGSPVLGISGRTRPGSGPERTSRAIGSAAPGHSFRKVTLTKPTFCHLCSDFIWGLAGFLCDVCNFMSHEKCLKQVKTPCTSIAPSLVRVPVAHCFGSLGLYKRKFCVVCRKSLEVPAFRCEATVVSATRMDSRIMTRITTTGGRGTCLLVHDVRSVGRLVVPQMCWLVYAASGVVYRLTQCAPQHLRLSVHLDVYAPWYCLLRVCACCPETSARCTVSESLRPWSWSLVMGMMA